ncbi:histidinol phosphate phosphatase H [Zalerion maritima]|uniref:Histidinol-phosphatase n=1 Tax=Zalerion maritima TaxID=339359 RepID=A0AAD5WPI1_9PEZI|nr:histidinol phosphate phosphatase H [Zalerion maritima]
MHSHSGQFCPGHAKDQLEEIITHAIGLGYRTMGLTEHMPRTSLEDLYPEELDGDDGDAQASLAELLPRHEAYMSEAERMQAEYASRIHILIGFEGEWIRGSDYGPLVKSLASDPRVDYFVGSLHHVCGVPIDLDRATYEDAVSKALALEVEQGKAGEQGGRDGKVDGGEKAVHSRYYDEQFEMLQELKPMVVGHFDLVRLLSSDSGRDVSEVWKDDVWEKMRRNLRFVVGYGGWLECNTSGLAKGMAEPYPARFIAEEYIKLGGKFTFSDDSHGIGKVAARYRDGLDYLESLGVGSVWTLEREPHPGVEGEEKSVLREKEVTLEEFRKSLK